MADPYQLLGVTRDSTPDDIRKAYRRLAKKSHPDLHPGDKAAEARFKEIASAYDIVGDETKRARFDAGEIDASGTKQIPYALVFEKMQRQFGAVRLQKTVQSSEAGQQVVDILVWVENAIT